MKDFDIESVKTCDGKDGKPAYIVHKGRVIDVTRSKLWKDGVHMRRHHAGRDLTVDIGGAPHGPEVLERYPQVGVVAARGPTEPAIPSFLAELFQRVPMLRRHPHPMTVHFPIVFMLSTTAFHVLYLLTGFPSLEITGLHCLAAGILFTPVVVGTGLLTWWVNYLARPMRAVRIKLCVSLMLFVDALTVLVWRILDPGILQFFSGAGVLYFLLVFLLTPMVVGIGWVGANLTFPVERES